MTIYTPDEGTAIVAKIRKLSSHLGEYKRLANTKMLSKLSARIEQILQLHLADTLRKTLQWRIYYVYAASACEQQLGKHLKLSVTRMHQNKQLVQQI